MNLLFQVFLIVGICSIVNITKAATKSVTPSNRGMVAEILDENAPYTCSSMFTKIDPQVVSMIHYHVFHTGENTDVLGRTVYKMQVKSQVKSNSNMTPYQMMLNPGPSDIALFCPKWRMLTDREKMHFYSFLLTFMAKYESGCLNNVKNLHATNGIAYGWFQAVRPYSETDMLSWGLSQLTRQIESETNIGNTVFWTGGGNRNYWAVLKKASFIGTFKAKLREIPLCK